MNTLLLSGALAGLAVLVDEVPSEDQIGGGWLYFVVFVALAGAVTFLAFSLAKHLRKARTNAEHGAFGDDPRG